MNLDQHKLARLQLAGMLGAVLTVVLILASYFFYQQWHDYQNNSAQLQRETLHRGQLFLRAYGDHAGMQLEAMYKQTHGILRQRLREQVDQAYDMASAIYRQNHTNLGREATARLITEALRPLRFFDGRGYFFIDTLQGQCVLLPTSPGLEGKSLLDNRDDKGTFIMRELIRSVDNPEARGYASYRWFRPGEKVMSEKITYSRRFDELGWLIGAGEYVSNVEEDLQRQGLDILGQMQIGEGGYLLVIDAKGQVRQLGSKQQQSVSEPALLKQLATMENGSFLGFSQNGTRMTAYAASVPSWQWRVLTILPDNMLQQNTVNDGRQLEESTRQRVITTLLILTVAICLAWLFSVYFSRWLRMLIGQYRNELKANAKQLSDKAREIELTRYMSDSAADAIIMLDSQSQIAYCNEAARRLFGARLQEMLPVLFRQDLRNHYCTLPLPGQELTLDVSLSVLDYQGERYRCATVRDISARLADERQLQLAATVFAASSEAILITDAQARIIAVNRSFSEITGYSADEAIGNRPSMLSSGKHDHSFFDSMWSQLRARGRWRGEIWNRRKNGDLYPEWLTINQVKNDRGEIIHYVALFSDISERKATERQVQRLAEYDYLTDLPNRMLLNDRLQQALNLGKRNKHRLAVLFMDLDRFKNVNDTLGHATGDALLRQVGQRTQHVLREMDTVGRTGGDEFVMILPELENSAQAGMIAERVLEIMQQPFDVEGHTLRIGASIGIAIAPGDGDTTDSLLKNADLAMYEAKAAGRNTYRFFNASMTAEVSERLLLENQLRSAIATQSFHLEFQPKFSLPGRQLGGFEALVRWRNEAGDIIPPVRFIPVAEDSGLINELGLWILRQACLTAAGWHRAGQSLIIAVNVSARQLGHGDFSADVADALRQSGLPAGLLELEVTESTLIDYAGPVRQQLSTLKQMGVRLAVDDFGTGYSSLAYLKNFAPDTVKIDRSFVRELQHNKDNAAIVSAIITLARNLEMEALAEGVETEDELAALIELGCDSVQGFLTGRPLPLEQAQALIARQAAATDSNETAAE